MDQPTTTKKGRKPADPTKPKAPIKSPRERWNALNVKRVLGARRAMRNVERMGNLKSYEYTPEEGAALLKSIQESYEAVRRAFTGAPKEKGIYDL